MQGVLRESTPLCGDGCHADMLTRRFIHPLQPCMLVGHGPTDTCWALPCTVITQGSSDHDVAAPAGIQYISIAGQAALATSTYLSSICLSSDEALYNCKVTYPGVPTAGL
jgi:hypothetical protein